MLTYVLIGIAVVLVLLLLLIAMQPATFSVARSARVAAPPPRVFAHVNDLRAWEAWSPWARLDPAMKTTYEGPPSGAGAIYTWSGNSQVGEGRITITESRPSDLIRIKLQFVRPFACTNDVEFTFVPEGGQTVVTWSMTGPKNFMAKAMHLVMNIDKMCGGQFEQGLAQLKAVVEAEA